MNKAYRELIRMKFNNKCAYCGYELEKGWHVDHLEPVRRGRNYNDELVLSHPERDCIDNQMPACASCNINKHSMTLEQFRKLIQGFTYHLNTLSTQYKISKRFGLIQETLKPVVFYFEDIAKKD